jgi:hypothetical protein
LELHKMLLSKLCPRFNVLLLCRLRNVTKKINKKKINNSLYIYIYIYNNNRY